MAKLLINAMLYDYDRFIPDGFLLFDEQIIEAGPMEKLPQGDHETIDAGGMLVLPGMACGHTHLYSAFARGLDLKLDIKNFKDILEQLWWRLDRGIDNRIAYASALSFGAEMLENGITTICDHHASGKEITGSLEAIKKAVVNDIGMRGVFAFETSDRFDVAKAVAENRDFAKNNRTERAAGTFGMHASMSMSEETIRLVKENFDGETIHVHVAESKYDTEDCLEKYGMSIIDRFDNYGLIGKDSLIVHGVFLNDSELSLLAKKDAVVCLNVSSNMNNGVGLPDIKNMKAKGVKVILGNDGLHAGMALEYLNLYYAMHHKYGSLTGLSSDFVKDAINETYDYLSRKLGISLGKFANGFAADFIIVPYRPATPIDSGNAMGHLLFGVYPGFSPKDVYVAGKMLVKDHELVNRSKKTEAIIKKAASDLWNNVNKEDEPWI
ncbi:MAG TPA: amidohydrolase family protein [Bacillota bacterium]|nr:amidohydrolase family protein [Bacillota bacterium]